MRPAGTNAIVFLWAGLFMNSLGEAAFPIPKWWDVQIHLKTTGRYAVNEPPCLLEGDFHFEAFWSGRMEKDDADYILYHNRYETLRWQIQEKNCTACPADILTEKDSSVQPVFRMNYILKEGAALRFNFLVEGFSVPLRLSKNKHLLLLPRTRKGEGGEPKGKYEISLLTGSNDVAVDEMDLYRSASEHSFRWTWKRYEAPRGEKAPPPFVNAHQVEITINIIPHH